VRSRKSEVSSLVRNIITKPRGPPQLSGPKVNKPFKEIYQFAAKKLGVEPSECLFIGENLNEVVGAEIAGMRAKRKEMARRVEDFAPALVGRIGGLSGRQWPSVSKLFSNMSTCWVKGFSLAVEKIGTELKKLTDGKAPPPR